MTGGPAPTARPSEILRQLWITLPAPIATEIGAVVALLTTSVPGILAALAAVAALALVLPYIRPPEAVTRVALLVAGPPLRYAVLLVAVGKTWLAREEGMVPALLLLLALGFIVPLIGFLVAQARARRG
jgi:hypothetical protein